MDYLIAGKLAFVAAGAHGIGAATADLLTGEGARVIVADSDGAALAEKQGRWHGTITADLSTAPGVRHAVAQVLEMFGRAPDILINNLGVGNATPFEDISEERWDRSVNINLMGSVRTLPGAAAEDGRRPGRGGGEHRVRPRQAARAGVHGLRRL